MCSSNSYAHPGVTDLELIAKFGKTDRELDLDILGRMSELSMYKRMLMIDKCTDLRKLRRHVKYWTQKMENLTNYPLEGHNDKKYVAMFQKLVEYTNARLEYAEAQLEASTRQDS